MKMKDRYSILRPLTVKEQEFFSIQILNFFSPLNYRENCKKIGIEPDKKVIRPLSFGDFLKFVKTVSDIDAYKYLYHLERIIQKMVNTALIVNAGNSQKGSPPLNHCYYAHFELTSMQKTNNFWLGKVLGEEFLMKKYEPLIIRFEGVYENGNSGTGSGIIINKNTILTCRHNLTDLTEYNCYLGDTKLKISEHKYHEIHDIGIVKLKEEIDIEQIPYFGAPYVLDNTLTMWYPPLRGMREAALISQKGEINAVSRDWHNCESITISSTVRPGNSGGPVISESGYIVGIVTQFANSASSVSADKDGFKDDHSIPFYNAISSTAIIEILKELDNSIPILYEDYQ